MKTKTLKQILVFITVLFSMTTTAQIVAFEYDEAGNRVLRNVLYLQPTVTDTTDLKQVQDLKLTLGETRVTLSPNPNGGRFSVKIEGYEGDISPQVFLHSINGSMIYENNNATILTEIDISNRENGSYILSLTLGSERKTWKIIKQ